MEGVDLAERHLLVAGRDGKFIQSFRFTFWAWKKGRRCLSCAGMNDVCEGLRLSEMSWEPWCKCA
jgi:hypothetical protein